MAEPYSTVFDPTRSLDNVLKLGYNPKALGVLSGAPIRWGNQPSGVSGGARDSGEYNILSIQNTLETAADPGIWDSLKDYFRVPLTGDRIIPTAEDNLNMARMLGIPGTSDYGGGIAEQSARQVLPVLEGMTNQEPEPEGGMWNSIRDFFIQPAGAQSDVPDENLFWVPPLKGKPVYPPGFRQETIDILEDNPGLDSDMVRHYVIGKEIGEKWGPTLGSIGAYAKEALDWMWPGSRAGFSLDDLLAGEAGIKGKSVQEALDAGVFKHTEPRITGYGQGLWDDVSRKAETLGIDLSPAERLKGFFDSPFRMQHEARGPSGPSRRTNIQRGGYIGSTPTEYSAPLEGMFRTPITFSEISHTDPGVGGDEIPEIVYNMPVISGEQLLRDQGITSEMPILNPFEAPDDLMIEDLIYNPPFAAAKELIPDITPERFDDFVTEAILGIDKPSEVEDFSAIQERADQERAERERAQVRADNQRRAEESREAQDRARENREKQEAQAEKARVIAERSKAADDRKSAARAQARADAAAKKERQATIQRQEDNRRRQATERAAAAQRQAEQQRERQAAARARNIAAENRLRSAMGGTNYAAYLRRGK